MSDEEGDWPELGEFLVCTITTVKQNGVYVDLDGYPGREGFIFIGEVDHGGPLFRVTPNPALRPLPGSAFPPFDAEPG